jgi:molecular chaperone GrpE (heat shock protein)
MEFLKENQKVQELEKQIKVLTSGLQKLSAELELQKPPAQTVVKNQ